MDKKFGVLLLTVLLLCAVCSSAMAAKEIRVTKAGDIPTCTSACWMDDWSCAEHFKDKNYLLTLDADVTLNEFLIPDNAAVTLDLNGHTLTMTPMALGTDDEGGGYVDNMGKLTIKDSKGSGKMISTHSFLISNYGYLTIEGGTLETKPGYTVIYDAENLAIKGGLSINRNASSEYVVVDHGDEPDCPGPQGDRKFAMTGGEIRQVSGKAPALLAGCFGDGAAITGGLINSAGEALRVWGPVKVAGEAKLVGDVKAQTHPHHGFNDVKLTIEGDALIEGDVIYVHNVYDPERAKPQSYEATKGSEVTFNGGTLKGKMYEGTLKHVLTYEAEYDEYFVDTPWDHPIQVGAPKKASRMIEFFVRSAIADANAPIQVKAGKFTEIVPAAYLEPKVERKATLATKTETIAYYGASEKEVAREIAEDAKPGDEITVITGSMDLTAVDAGVVLTKAPEAQTVTLNGVTVVEKAVVQTGGVVEVLPGNVAVEDLPKTGDDSQMILWTLLLGLCCAGMMLVRKTRSV